MAETKGTAVTVNIVRAEGDTNDIRCHLKNADDTDATVTGWTAVLSIGDEDNQPLVPPVTFPGVGGSGGVIAIDMNGFAVPVGTYKYDVRITDTATGDSPARVYFKGAMKVVDRIN